MLRPPSSEGTRAPEKRTLYDEPKGEHLVSYRVIFEADYLS